MKQYSIKKNKHWWTPLKMPQICKGDFRLDLFFKFDESCIYRIKGPDSKDFNKLGGMSENIWTNRKNASMIGWRSNWKEKTIELSAFFNVGWGHRVGGHIISVDPGTCVNAYIEKKGTVRVVAIVDPVTDIEFRSMQNFKINRWAKTAGLWFGGTSRAPKNMMLELSTELYKKIQL